MPVTAAEIDPVPPLQVALVGVSAKPSASGSVIVYGWRVVQGLCDMLRDALGGGAADRKLNTTGVADGIVYGNYLKTFNIAPHSG